MNSLFEFDICFCANSEKCARKNTCERSMTEDQKERAKSMQMLSFSYFYKKGEKCTHYVRRKNG